MLLALATLAACLFQSPADSLHPAPAPALGAIHPLLGTFHYVMDQRAAPDSAWRELGTATITRISNMGRLINVASYTWVSGKATIDTTISLSSTLAPLSERTVTPSRIVAYDFSGLRSKGKIGPAKALKPIDDRLPQAAFNSTDFDMLVTGLPLSEHFHATLPLYDPEYPGFRMNEVTVDRVDHPADATSPRGVWLVTVTDPKHAPMHYRIDVATHRMLEKDFGMPGKTEFRVREVPAGS